MSIFVSIDSVIMKKRILVLIILFASISCKDDTVANALLISNNFKEKELKFQNISKAWNFVPRELSPESQTIATNWNEWRMFNSELYLKPKSTIGAFQRKTKTLVQKAEVLHTSVPEKLNKPQIKARLMAMITKLKSLDTFINLDKIPVDRVIPLLSDLNIEINVIQDQIEEIVQRSHIQKEEGEEQMLQNLKKSPQTP